MLAPGASAYFRNLLGTLLATHVSERSGAALSLDAGMRRVLDMVGAVVGAHARTEFESSKILLVGNGGSAAIASHVQNDLCKALGVRALVFNEAPLLTALANDIDYASAFARLTELWVDDGDLLIAISSSGSSENILRAVRTAAVRNCRVVTFSGFRPDNPLRQLGTVNFYVPCRSYGQVEVAHNALLHFLIDRAAELAAAAGHPAPVIGLQAPRIASRTNA